MKKLFLASISLLIFSCAILILQISCSKSTAQSSATSQLNKILLVKNFGSTSFTEFWIINYDGTGLTRITPNCPTNVTVYDNAANSSAPISPDGTKLFFRGKDSSLGIGVYRCDINGSNVVRVTDISANDVIAGAY